MLNIKDTKDIIINNFQFLSEDQIYYCVPMINVKDLYNIIFLENNIDKVLLHITDNQYKQLYYMVFRRLLKNIKLFEI